MDFLINQEVLLQGLTTVSRTIGRDIIPASTCVLIESLGPEIVLTATNIEQTTSVSLPATVNTQGELLISGQMLLKFVRKCDSGSIISVKANDTAISITTNRTTTKFVGLKPESFPIGSRSKLGNSFDLPMSELLRLISQVGFAVDEDNLNPIFTGASMSCSSGRLKLCGSDNKRLSLAEVNLTSVPADFSVIVPAKALTDLAKFAKSPASNVRISIAQNESYMQFEFDNTAYRTQLVNGNYMDISNYIPTSFDSVITVSKFEILGALERAKAVIEERGNVPVVTLQILADTINVYGKSQNGTFQEEVAGDLDGNTLKASFNIQYLLDGLAVCNSAEAELCFKDGIPHCVIRQKEMDTYKYLAMRVQIA